jgi:hypothetical protein
MAAPIFSVSLAGMVAPGARPGVVATALPGRAALFERCEGRERALGFFRIFDFNCISSKCAVSSFTAANHFRLVSRFQAIPKARAGRRVVGPRVAFTCLLRPAAHSAAAAPPCARSAIL